MDILIFNMYRTVRTTTNSYTQKMLDLKNKPDLKICVIFKICNRSNKTRYSFRDNLPFPLSSLAHLAKVVLLPISILDDDKAGVDNADA